MNSLLLKNKIKLLVQELERDNSVLYGHIEDVRCSLLQYEASTGTMKVSAKEDPYAIHIDHSVFQEAPINHNKLINELRRIDGGFDMLFKLLRQRVVSSNGMSTKDKAVVNDLEKKNLITIIELGDNSIDGSYYTLSGRGLSLLDNKEARNRIKTFNNRYTLPSWCCYTLKSVSESMLSQAVRLNCYMNQIGNADYISFFLPGMDDLLLSCEIAENNTVRYACSPDLLDVHATGQLIGRLCSNDKLDNLVVVEHKHKSIELIKTGIPVKEQYKTKLAFYCLEETNEQ